MKKIANIVTGVELTNHKKLDWTNYAQSTSDCDLTIPTLIVGWNRYKTEFPHLYPNILEKKSIGSSPLWWEFSLDEKVVDHFNGVEKFVKTAPRAFCELYKYQSIDPIKDMIGDEWDLISRIPLTNSFMYQYKDEIIYVLDCNENKIYGIYLNAFKYFKYDIQLIMDRLSNRIEKRIIDRDGTLYQSYYKLFPDFDQLKRTIVLFLE